MTEVLIPMEQRICAQCGSNKTHHDQWYDSSLRNYAHWYNDGQGGVICKKCYGIRKHEKIKASGGKVIDRVNNKSKVCLDCGNILNRYNLKFCNKMCRRRFEILR